MGSKFEIIPSGLDEIYGAGAASRERERFGKQYGFMDEAVPFSDEMYGGINAAMDMVRSGKISWDQFKKLYSERKGIADSAQAGYRDRNPVTSVVADVTGGLAAAPGRAAQIAYPLAKSVAGGAVGGAVGGFDEGKTPADRMSGAAVGAGIGSVAAGAAYGAFDLVGRLARSLAPGGQDAAAAARARRAVVMAMQKDGVNVADLTHRMMAGKPLTVADLGPNSRSLIGAAYRAGGDGKAVIEQFFEQRSLDQIGRMTDDVAGAVGAQPSEFGPVSDALRAERRSNAADLYDPAFRSTGVEITEPLAAILSTPAGKDALRAARKAVENKRAAKTDEAGNLTVEFLDQVQRHMRGKADAARRGGNGEVARDLDALRGELIDSLPPELRTAMQQYRLDSEKMDAIALGREFMKGDSETLGKTIAGYTPEQKDLFRLGAARELRGKMAKTNDNSDLTRTFRNEDMRERIKYIFGDTETYQTFMQRVAAEEQMQITRNTTLKGSQTAQRGVEDAAFEQGNVNEVADLAAGGMRGGVLRALLDYGVQKAHGANRRFVQGLNERVGNQLGKIGTNTDLGAVQQMLTAGPSGQLGPVSQRVQPGAAIGLYGSPREKKPEKNWKFELIE